MGTIKTLLSKLNHCDTYRDLYKLTENLEAAGLYITHTTNGNKVMCRVENGKPCTSKIFDDYIFIEGALDQKIDNQSKDIMKIFISYNAGTQRVVPGIPSYQDNYRLYGKPVRINEETKVMSEQHIHVISRLIEG